MDWRTTVRQLPGSEACVSGPMGVPKRDNGENSLMPMQLFSKRAVARCAIIVIKFGFERQGEGMKKLALGMATAMVVAASPAYAAPLLFNFSGPSGTAMFQLDSNSTPAFSQTFIGSDQFSFNNVAGTFGGLAGTASTVSFGNGIFSSLSITATNLGFTQFNAPTLFTGSPSKPTFLTGSFTLINPFFGNGQLTISPVAAAVPEPATWAMMILGMGAVGFAMRRRHKVTTRVSYAA